MKPYDEISSNYHTSECGDPVAQYTGEEFPALDNTYQTTEVLLYVVGTDDDGWIIRTQDQYEDGELTIDAGTDQAGREVYPSADAATAAAQTIAAQRS